MGNGSELFIGMDAGTSVIKAVLFDADGHELAVAQKSVPLQSPKPGFQEMDMNKVWEAAVETIRAVLQKNGGGGEKVAAIGLTGQGCGAWLIDGKGQPVRNAILWNDERAVDIVNQWVQSGAAEEIYKINGCDPFSGSQGAILSWLALNEPETLEASHKALYCKDWIKYKLTGIISTEPSEASIAYFDQTRWEYSKRILELTGVESFAHLLPEIRPSNESAGELLPQAAQQLGLDSRVKVVSAAFDISSCAIGVGAVNDGDACTILGTSLINEVVIDKLETAPINVGFTVPLGAPSRWVRMLNTKLGTPNQDWFLNNFCHQDFDLSRQQDVNVYNYLKDKVSQIPIGAEGILYHPFLSAPGVRAPFLNANAKAQFTGLTPEHTRHHLLRAIFEGTALAARLNFENIPRKVSNLRLSGGGSRSPLWCQIISDVLNVPVKVPAGSEFGARGAVINAAVAVGYFDSYDRAVQRFVQFDREYQPDASSHEKYDHLYDIYLKVYRNMSDTWDALAKIRSGATG